MSLLKDFEALCKYVRECTGDDIVCGLCEYDAGTVGEEPMECPGFESNECFVLKESLRKQYEMYAQVIRCKDCKHQRKEYREDKRRKDGGYNIYWCDLVDGYAPLGFDDEYCAWAERKDEYVTLHHEDINFIDEDAERAFYESLAERKEE